MERNINKEARDKMAAGGKKSNAIVTSYGGRLVRGRYINKDSPLAKTMTACTDCSLGKSCEHFSKKGYCKWQIDTLKASKQMQNALVSDNPVDFLTNLQSGIARLEADVEYKKRIEGKLCLNEQKEVLFLKMQLFEMTHGKAKPTTQVNINAPVVDMKSLMDEERKKTIEPEFEVVE